MVDGTLESNLSVRWKVSIAKDCPYACSPCFEYLDSNWFMTFTRWDPNTDSNICLKLYKQSSSGNERFNILVEVENCRTGQVIPSLSEWKTTVAGGEYIWCQLPKDIIQVYPEFAYNRQLAFRLTFTDRKPEQVSTERSKITTDASVQTSAIPTINPCLKSLVEDYAKLLGEDSKPDVELHCEGHITKAHKNVLCVRSPVLAKMLQSDMVEGRSGVANIQDMTNDTFQQFLRYLYTGKLNDALTFEEAMRLFEGGDMYQVQSLTRRCSEFLIEKLTVVNACDVLTLADAHSDSCFVEAVIAYMLKKKVPLCGDRWRAFCKNQPMLANDVLNRFIEMHVSKEDRSAKNTT